MAGLTDNNKRYLLLELVPCVIKAQEEPETTTSITTTVRHGKVIGQKVEINKAIK
jgi:hypothetical protein